MVLCHKWNVINDFAYMLQFFSLIFDGLGSVYALFSRSFYGCFLVPFFVRRKLPAGLNYVEPKKTNYEEKFTFYGPGQR